MVGTPKKESLDKYYDYHGEKGHYTNDCYQLKRRLEAALGSEMLSHLVKMLDAEETTEEGIRGTKTQMGTDDVSDEPLIIEAEVESYQVQKVFVDQGSAVQVMFEHCFDNLPPSIRARLTQTHTELVEFSREQLILMGNIELSVMFKKKNKVVMIEVEEWVKAGILRPVRYPTWISNPVMVKKVDGNEVNMKLNPKKCSFGVKEGKFLGYMVTLKGIRANLKKTKAVADMQSQKTLKEMQILRGKLAALNRFLSRSAKQALPFFKTLKNITKEIKDDYQWMEDAEHTQQTRGVRKLAKYVVELGAYNITYVPQNAIKGQVLADFINEVPMGTKHMKICSLADAKILKEWTLYTDGASSLKGVGSGLVLIKLTRTDYTYAIRLNFPRTNNEALLAGLRIAEKIKARALKVKVD
nr:reverse transcriptase domain-containing protein [Tanacetum cinerariifolium]